MRGAADRAGRVGRASERHSCPSAGESLIAGTDGGYARRAGESAGNSRTSAQAAKSGRRFARVGGAGGVAVGASVQQDERELEWI